MTSASDSEIDAVVLEHRLEWRRVTVADEPEESRRDLEARHVADAVEACQVPLEHRQLAAVFVERRTGDARTLLPQPPRRVEHVDVRPVGERKGQSMEQVARFDQRHVERTAVERDERLVIRHPRADFGQQRPLVLESRQQILPHVNRLVFEDGETDEEGLRAGAARQPGGLEIEEQQVARGRSGAGAQRPGTPENLQRILARGDGPDNRPNPFPAVRPGGCVMPIDDDHGALRALDDTTTKDIRRSCEIWRAAALLTKLTLGAAHGLGVRRNLWNADDSAQTIGKGRPHG